MRAVGRRQLEQKKRRMAGRVRSVAEERETEQMGRRR